MTKDAIIKTQNEKIERLKNQIDYYKELVKFKDEQINILLTDPDQSFIVRELHNKKNKQLSKSKMRVIRNF